MTKQTESNKTVFFPNNFRVCDQQILLIYNCVTLKLITFTTYYSKGCHAVCNKYVK